MEYEEAKKKPTTNQKKQKAKRIQKHEKSVMSLWDNFKCTNIHIIGVTEGEERESKKLKTYLKK